MRNLHSTLIWKSELQHLDEEDSTKTSLIIIYVYFWATSHKIYILAFETTIIIIHGFLQYLYS